MIFCVRATRGLRRPSLDARSGRSISPHPWRDNKRAWWDHFDWRRSLDSRSKRQAIQPSLALSSALKFKELLWRPRCPTSGFGKRFVTFLQLTETHSGLLGQSFAEFPNFGWNKLGEVGLSTIW